MERAIDEASISVGQLYVVCYNTRFDCKVAKPFEIDSSGVCRCLVSDEDIELSGDWPVDAAVEQFTLRKTLQLPLHAFVRRYRGKLSVKESPATKGTAMAKKRAAKKTTRKKTTSKASSDINKSEEIRQYIAANPKAMPKDAAEALSKKHGIDFTAQMVSTVKNNAKKKKAAKKKTTASKKQPRQESTNLGGLVDTQIDVAAELLRQAGSAKDAKAVIDRVEQIAAKVRGER